MAYVVNETGKRVRGRGTASTQHGSDKAWVAKQKSLRDKLEAGQLKALSCNVFLRDPKRKPKEPWHVYKRSMRNRTKALKMRLKYGPKADVYIDRETLTIVW